MKRHPDPIQQRRSEIEREISKIQSPKNQKKRTDYKTAASFDNSMAIRTAKLDELYEESAMLAYPENYNELPLAVAASELFVSLSDIESIVAEGIVDVSYRGYSLAGSRITREELSRAIDIGKEELLRRTRLEIFEIFEEALDAMATRDLTGALKAYRRIEEHDSCINPFALAIEIGISFLEGKVADLENNIAFILKRSHDDIVQSLSAVRTVFTALPAGSHLLESIREKVVAIADGAMESPFRDSFYPYKGTQFPSQMDANQNFAIYIGDVVLDSIRRYKLIKSFYSRRSDWSEIKREEIERVIHNAIYTALEAHRTYNESPSSKLYVDQFVGSKSSRRKPPELIELLPKCGRTT